MNTIIRFQQTFLLAYYMIFLKAGDSRFPRKNNGKGSTHYGFECMEVPAKEIPLVLKDPAHTSGPNGTLGFFVPLVFPLAAPFILFRLKRSGFSGCRVTVQEGGLLVKAIR